MEPITKTKPQTNEQLQRQVQQLQAELQQKNSELQIEASLEGVRARAMAMHSSEDLSDTVNVFFKELKDLGVIPVRCGVGQVEDESRTTNLTVTTASQQGESFQVVGKLKQAGHPVLEAIYDNWKLQKDYFPVLRGPDIKAYYAVTKNQIAFPEYDENVTQYGNIFYFKEGFVFAWTAKELSEHEMKVFRRFTSVLSLTYRRYADLKEAEAQAREAKIEAALERVRSRTMAMQRSDELPETVHVLFQQFMELGEAPNQMNIGVANEEEGVFEISGTDPNSVGSKFEHIVKMPFTEPMLMKPMHEAWRAQKKSISFDLHGQALIDYIHFRSKIRGVPVVPEHMQGHRIINAAFFSKGSISISTLEPRPASTIALLERFAGVFDLTYTRFLDLKQAEAQAREAKIEAALEWVRSRTMAMQHSDELPETVHVLFQQFKELGEAPDQMFIALFNEEEGFFEVSGTDPNSTGSKFQNIIKIPFTEPITIKPIYEAWKAGKKSITFNLHGQALIDYVKLRSSLRGVPVLPEQMQGHRYINVAFFSKGTVTISTLEPRPESTIALLERFASVFDLTYTRFLDLQKAEAQALEAKIERERSEALLLNILPADIAEELKKFGKSYARSHEQVTILFADIKGFSTIAENLSPQELVNQLDECFRAFDHIVEKHGLEKIKTIGDAYMCACGLPKPVPDNAVRAVKAALDMMEFIKGFGITKSIQDLPAFEFRIGIHTGPVVTGVVGLKKFTYDMWGDAVNLAARMEQHGEAGKINISDDTFQLVKDKFTCTYRGKIPAKNKGEVDMYFVERSLM